MQAPSQKLTLEYYAAFVEKLRRLYGDSVYVDISIRGIDEKEFNTMRRLNGIDLDCIYIANKTATGDVEFRTEHHIDSPKGTLPFTG